MKKLAIPMLALALGLTACGKSEEPAAEGGNVVKEGQDWTADTQQEGAVDVKLPDTPVQIDTTKPEAAPDAAGKGSAEKPAAAN